LADETSRKSGVDALRREGWRLKLPDSPLTLEDSRLLEYRHPAEPWMLALATTIIALLAIRLLFRETEVLIGIAVVYFSMLVTSMQAKTFYRLQGAEVTSTQFPAIFKIAEDLRQRFGAPSTRIFVLRMQSFKAEAFGFKAPYVIALPAVLIDSLEAEELRYVLGQALGHICFGHTRVALLMGGEESALPAVLSWFAWIRDLIFAGYWRAATTSGDRAGILACQSVVKAIRTQVKISVGSNQVNDVRTEDFVEQAFKVSQSFARFQAMLIRWRTPIPPLIPRLENMIAWAGLPPLERD
jgi:Zn-dependent protease with chaperone function